LVVGGGGGALSGGGGAGGVSASDSISVGTNGLNYAVGNAGSQGGHISNTTSGDPSTLSNPGVWTMTGGAGGTSNASPYNRGGSSGAGSGGVTSNSTSYLGGFEQYGCVESATGGGGGAGGAGADAYYVGYTLYAGNAGAAVTFYGITVSSGGPGGDFYSGDGYQNGSFTTTSYGGGGARYEPGNLRAPQAGVVRFVYYGP